MSPLHTMALALAVMAPPSSAGLPHIPASTRGRDEIAPTPRLVGVRGANAHPAELNRLARKNARARQTKPGKRGRG